MDIEHYSFLTRKQVFLLELHADLGIDQPASQVVWYGILLVAHVSHPVIGVDVIDAKQVQTVHS